MNHVEPCLNHFFRVNSDAHRALQRDVSLMRGVPAPLRLVNVRQHRFGRGVRQCLQFVFGIGQMPPAQIVPGRLEAGSGFSKFATSIPKRGSVGCC